MNNIKGEIFSPFSPKIGKFKLKDEIIDDLNIHIDKIIKDKDLSISLDHSKNLAGQVTQEIKLTIEFLSKGLLNEFANATKAFIQGSEKKEITKFNLISSWVVRQFKNEYNPIHWHGGHISGVAYLKVPEKLNHENSKQHIHKNGNIEFVHGSTQFLSSSTFTLKPEIGDLYIFPHYLMHTVYPFYGEGERRSVSFNSFIDDKIFNVHNN